MRVDGIRDANVSTVVGEGKRFPYYPSGPFYENAHASGNWTLKSLNEELNELSAFSLRSRVVDSNQGCTNKTPLLNFSFFSLHSSFFLSLNTLFWQYVNLHWIKKSLKRAIEHNFLVISLRIRESFNNHTSRLLWKSY